MSSLPRRRRVKKPTLLVKRSLVSKNNHFNKRSYKPLYEKVKANNNALAKALSNEKQESQYLYRQNIQLTSEVQELGVACNRRDDIIAGVLKNAKETLQHIITISSYVTNTIATCQQVVTTTRYTPRKSTSNNRRDSTRRLSGKSPARGVVQPMVSGHTITKPTINLSRLNIQREYRVQNPPNLSDIEEVLTPTQSPAAVESTTPVRIPIARSLNYGTRRVDRLPERFQASIRTSDENERHSSVRSNRNSSRHSGRRSHRTSERMSAASASRRSTSELLAGKSPRVALHDVSRLLHNSQSVNIRTLLENSSEGIIAETSEETEPENDETPPAPEDSKSRSSSKKWKIPSPRDEDSSKKWKIPSPRDEDSSKKWKIPSPRDEDSSKKWKTPSPRDEDDPLEGPSWLLDESENVSFPAEPQSVSTEINGGNQSVINEEPEEEGEDDERQEAAAESTASPVAAAAAPQPSPRQTEQTNHNDRWANRRPNFYQNFNEDDRTATMNFGRFVTNKRGSVCEDDDDDYTLLWKRPGAPKNYNFDLNDLELPVLESPIVRRNVEPQATEPDPTTNIFRITQNYGNMTPGFSRENADETFFNHTGLMLPLITENPDSSRGSAVVAQERQHSEEEEDEAEEEVVPRKRKRAYKKKVMRDSASDSDWVPTPKRANSKSKKRSSSKMKDPSSAKVVLQKLNDTHVRKTSPSPEPRQSEESERHCQSVSTSVQRDASSDSEGSNASSNVKSAPSRPRRQKAPKNLQEPSLGKKLRRN